MGVMNCARNGCENILCSRYSYTYGYICPGCFEELVIAGKEQDISEFMDSAMPTYDDAARVKFSNEFPSRHDVHS